MVLEHQNQAMVAQGLEAENDPVTNSADADNNQKGSIVDSENQINTVDKMTASGAMIRSNLTTDGVSDESADLKKRKLFNLSQQRSALNSMDPNDNHPQGQPSKVLRSPEKTSVHDEEVSEA